MVVKKRSLRKLREELADGSELTTVLRVRGDGRLRMGKDFREYLGLEPGDLLVVEVKKIVRDGEIVYEEVGEPPKMDYRNLEIPEELKEKLKPFLR